MLFKRRAFLALFLVFLVIIILNLQRERALPSKPETTIIDSFLVTLYSPIQKGWNALTGGVGRTWDDYIVTINLKKENDRLKEELALKELYILSLKERLRVSDRERYMDQKLSLLGLKGVPARVIGYDPQSQSQSFWVSAGSAQGVREDHPVMTLEGLVGRVVQVYPNAAQVLLLADPHFAVDVINEETRARALVVGSGYEVKMQRYPLLSHLEFLKLGDEMRPGDLLITSGLSGIYPAGIPVGHVIDAEGGEKTARHSDIVLPLVDFSKLEQIFIVTGIHSDESIPVPGAEEVEKVKKRKARP